MANGQKVKRPKPAKEILDGSNVKTLVACAIKEEGEEGISEFSFLKY